MFRVMRPGLELMVRCRCKKVVDVPITFRDRVAGESKLSMKQNVLYVQQLIVLYLDSYVPPSTTSKIKRSSLRMKTYIQANCLYNSRWQSPNVGTFIPWLSCWSCSSSLSPRQPFMGSSDSCMRWADMIWGHGSQIFGIQLRGALDPQRKSPR